MSGTLSIVFKILILILRFINVLVIYYNCNSDSKKTRGLIAGLAIPFPLIAGIICVTKYKKSVKNTVIVLITMVATIASSLAISYVYNDNTRTKYYDKDGTAHYYLFEVKHIDADGNIYTYDYDKSGYDYFYINSTEERLNSDWCYLDGNGYLYYDDDLSVKVYNEDCCIDEDGSIYYRAKYASFNEDGSLNNSLNSYNFSYDRFGNAYTYDYVPFYDRDGNKYYYSFDSQEQKGYYTNVATKEVFENEYSFVDEDGYFVYDEEHSFVQQEEVKNVREYKDPSGSTYYWASGISWNKDAQLLDSYGNVMF